MRTVAADIGERRRAVAVDLDPEHAEIGDLPQDFQIALGLGVEVEIEQEVDIGPAPARMASRWTRRLRRTVLSTLSSGTNGTPNPGRQARGAPRSYIKMLVLRAVKPLSRTSAPIALTPSRLVIDGL